MKMVAKDRIELPTRGFSIILAAHQPTILLIPTPRIKQGISNPAEPVFIGVPRLLNCSTQKKPTFWGGQNFLEDARIQRFGLGGLLNFGVGIGGTD